MLEIIWWLFVGLIIGAVSLSVNTILVFGIAYLVKRWREKDA